MGDFYLSGRLIKMGNEKLNTTLVNLNAYDLSMRETETMITSAGTKVLNKDVNVLEINGIDDRVGGMHLNSDSGDAWVRKNGSLYPLQV